MDRQAEKQKRITEEFVPYINKLLQDPKNNREFIQYDAMMYSRKTWMLSTPVARDYAITAVAIARDTVKNPSPVTV